MLFLSLFSSLQPNRRRRGRARVAAPDAGAEAPGNPVPAPAAEAEAPGRDVAVHGGGAIAASARNGARARGWILTGFQVPGQEEGAADQADAGQDAAGERSSASPPRRRPRVGSPGAAVAGGDALQERAERVEAPRLFARGVNTLLERADSWDSKVAYYCWQVERCPDTGRLHTHLYCRGSVMLSFAYLGRCFPGWHLEIRKGTEAQAVAYCTKEETRVWGPFEHGDRAAPGARTDIAAALAIVKSGGGVRGVIETGAGYQCLKYAETVLRYMEPQRDWQPECFWYFGSTGSGKTRGAWSRALEFLGGDTEENRAKVWMSGRTLKWWQGYDAHPVVIIDDFRKDFCTFHELLRILDRYAFVVENKGGSRQLLAKLIIVTCPWAPDVLYEGQADLVLQLLRRLGCQAPDNDRSHIVQFGDVVPMGGASVPHFVAPPV